MVGLLATIQQAIRDDRFLIGWHADERCEERGITAWQIVAGLEDARLLRERARSQPHPTVVVRQTLADGSEVEAVWAFLARSRRALLVTVYFVD